MKVLDIENIKIPSSNKRLIPSKTSKRWTLSPEYRAFKDLIIKYCTKTKIDPPYSVIIFVYMHKNKDIDNIIKPILDGLQKAGVIDDDKNVYILEVYKRISNIEKLNVEVLHI